MSQMVRSLMEMGKGNIEYLDVCTILNSYTVGCKFVMGLWHLSLSEHVT